jgi:hypothetical protein
MGCLWVIFGWKGWSQNYSDFDIMHLRYVLLKQCIYSFSFPTFPPPLFLFYRWWPIFIPHPSSLIPSASHIPISCVMHARNMLERYNPYFLFPFAARVALVSISTPPLGSQFTSRPRAISLLKRRRGHAHARAPITIRHNRHFRGGGGRDERGIYFYFSLIQFQVMS